MPEVIYTAERKNVKLQKIFREKGITGLAGCGLVKPFHKTGLPPRCVIRVNYPFLRRLIQCSYSHPYSFPGALKLAGSNEPSRFGYTGPTHTAYGTVSQLALFILAHLLLC